MAIMRDSSQKVRTSVQPAGWILVLFGFMGLFVLGFIFGDGVLLVLSILSLVLFVVSWWVGKCNLKGLDLQVKMPERVYAGKGFEVLTYLDNQKSWLDSFDVHLSLHVLHQVEMRSHARWVGARDGARLSKRIGVPLRGATSALKAGLRSSFPLGLFQHSVQFEIPQSLIVYPRLITPLEVMTCGSLNDADPQRGAQFGEAMGEPRGVRSWQPGDSAKRIHWPASARSLARGQGLRVREYDPPGFTPRSCMVIFHSHAEHGEVYRHDRFERASSLAAGTLHYLHSRQVKASFTADFLGWQVMECENRAQYIELLAILAQSNRSVGTEQHDFQAALEHFSTTVDQLVIVSDIDPDAWSDGMKLPENALVIDIRQMRFKRQHFAIAS